VRGAAGAAGAAVAGAAEAAAAVPPPLKRKGRAPVTFTAGVSAQQPVTPEQRKQSRTGEGRVSPSSARVLDVGGGGGGDGVASPAPAAAAAAGDPPSTPPAPDAATDL
jgi:hypothetical protein